MQRGRRRRRRPDRRALAFGVERLLDVAPRRLRRGLRFVRRRAARLPRAFAHSRGLRRHRQRLRRRGGRRARRQRPTARPRRGAAVCVDRRGARHRDGDRQSGAGRHPVRRAAAGNRLGSAGARASARPLLARRRPRVLARVGRRSSDAPGARAVRDPGRRRRDLQAGRDGSRAAGVDSHRAARVGPAPRRARASFRRVAAAPRDRHRQPRRADAPHQRSRGARRGRELPPRARRGRRHGGRGARLRWRDDGRDDHAASARQGRDLRGGPRSLDLRHISLLRELLRALGRHPAALSRRGVPGRLARPRGPQAHHAGGGAVDARRHPRHRRARRVPRGGVGAARRAPGRRDRASARPPRDVQHHDRLRDRLLRRAHPPRPLRHGHVPSRGPQRDASRGLREAPARDLRGDARRLRPLADAVRGDPRVARSRREGGRKGAARVALPVSHAPARPLRAHREERVRVRLRLRRRRHAVQPAARSRDGGLSPEPLPPERAPRIPGLVRGRRGCLGRRQAPPPGARCVEPRAVRGDVAVHAPSERAEPLADDHPAPPFARPRAAAGEPQSQSRRARRVPRSRRGGGPPHQAARRGGRLLARAARYGARRDVRRPGRVLGDGHRRQDDGRRAHPGVRRRGLRLHVSGVRRVPRPRQASRPSGGASRPGRKLGVFGASRETGPGWAG